MKRSLLLYYYYIFVNIFGNCVKKIISFLNTLFSKNSLHILFPSSSSVRTLSGIEILNQNSGCTQHHFSNLDQMDSVKYFEARQNCSDWRIWRGRLCLYSYGCCFMLHNRNNAFTFFAWSVLPRTHLVTALLLLISLIPPMVLASLARVLSPLWSTSVRKWYWSCACTDRSPSSRESNFLSFSSAKNSNFQIVRNYACWLQNENLKNSPKYTVFPENYFLV